MSAQRSGPRDSAAAAPARITRRGRLLLVLLLAGLLFAAFSAGRVTSKAATGPLPTRAVVVRPGESLWVLASRIDPVQDPRITVVQLERLNHLAGAALVVGQTVLVPRLAAAG